MGVTRHCPSCHKLVLKDYEAGAGSFSLRCPWCQADVAVTIKERVEFTVTLTARVNRR